MDHGGGCGNWQGGEHFLVDIFQPPSSTVGGGMTGGLEGPGMGVEVGGGGGTGKHGEGGEGGNEENVLSSGSGGSNAKTSGGVKVATGLGVSCVSGVNGTPST